MEDIMKEIQVLCIRYYNLTTGNGGKSTELEKLYFDQYNKIEEILKFKYILPSKYEGKEGI